MIQAVAEERRPPGVPGTTEGGKQVVESDEGRARGRGQKVKGGVRQGSAGLTNTVVNMMTSLIATTSWLLSNRIPITSNWLKNCKLLWNDNSDVVGVVGRFSLAMISITDDFRPLKCNRNNNLPREGWWRRSVNCRRKSIHLRTR